MIFDSIKERLKNYEQVEIQGKRIWIPYPDKMPNINYVERVDIIEQALTAWMNVDTQQHKANPYNHYRQGL